MGLGRPPLPIGTFGDINVTREERPNNREAYRAVARFRDADGVTRQVVRYAPKKSDARAKLNLALMSRQHAAAAAMVTPDTTVEQLSAIWLTTDNTWSVNTGQAYQYAVANLIPVLGSVRIRELKVPVIDRGLATIRDTRGASAAKTSKTVLSLMCRLAVAYDALQGNPLREVTVGAARKPKKPIRALTEDEQTRLCDAMRSDDRAVYYDLPDLVEWMLGTGCRIGEALACRYLPNSDGEPLLDLTAGTWEINATALRMKGVGVVVQEKTKSEAGWRILALPPYLHVLLERRRQESRMAPESAKVLRDGKVLAVESPGIVFTSPAGKLRDGSNTAGDLRETLDRLGFEWVTSHVFRKTVATKLLNAGVAPQQVADHLGHNRPSMTLDFYAGRHVVSADAARVLER